MGDTWKCKKCGATNSPSKVRVSGMSFGSSFSADMARMQRAAEQGKEKVRTTCLQCGEPRSILSRLFG